MKLLAIAAALFATVLTTSSTALAGPASPGAVNRLLTGGVVDPMATTLKVVPPRGGMVLVHQNGNAVAWFSRAGFVNLKPNRIYSISATRGQTLMFTTNVMMRRGYTEMIWGKSSAPQMSFVPAYGAGFRQPAFANGRRSPARSSSRAGLPSRSHRNVVSRMGRMRTDGQRWRTMNRYNKKYALSASQKRAMSRTFKSRTYRKKAERALGLKSARKSTARKSTARKSTARTKSAKRPRKSTKRTSRSRTSKRTTRRSLRRR